MKLSGIEERNIEEEIYICAQCGFCHVVCPVYEEIGWESASPRGKIYFLKQLLKSGIFGPKVGINAKFVDRVFQCTLCGHCHEVCQTSIDTTKLWKALRNEIYRRGRWPEALRDLNSSVHDQKNVYRMPNEDRNIWAMSMEDAITPKVKKKAKVAYFVGCISSFMGRLASIPESMTQVMDRLGIDYTVLGGEEWCCGNPLSLAGIFPPTESIIRHNVERLRELGIEILVATCAGCYRMWTQEYPKILNEDLGFEVLHASEFLAKFIDENRLKFKGKIEGVVTYHDPCELGRHCKIYEAPRKVLENIPGVKFTELSKARKDCRCCGGGGLLKATNPELALKIALRKVNEVAEVGARVLVSGCPACKLNLEDAIIEGKADLEMLDVTEIVARVL